AKLFMEAKQAAQAAPDVRTDRVEALKPLVQSGTYPLDSKKIAADLIATEPGLFI
ncbi:MAG: flagellar biosynthesis anti-sigma factor FlgM, partial [Desulfovibrionaceae bacterium]|nr:flagellar biosynthesis anti-sigma factor FlgM [Desulfovibrionaceae bacterium]